MREKGEEQQHKNPANPDEKVQRHFGIVNLFLIHTSNLAPASSVYIGSAQ